MTDLRPERAVAAFDSSSAMLRATANALQDKDFPHLGRGSLEAAPVRLAGLLPLRLRQLAFTFAGAAEGIPVDRLGDVDMEKTAEWVVAHYPHRPYPGVVLGSANGAAVHAWAGAGMPWLPQTLLLPVRWSDNDADDPTSAMEFGRKAAPRLLARNPEIRLHHMHDGNQDRLMVSRMTYFRVKWTRLPRAYTEFVERCLEPDAPIVLLDDESSWPTVTVDERHVFQTGALGGMSPQEYVERFDPPTPDGTSPEAEWGFDHSLTDSVTSLANHAEHPVVRLSTPGPQELSEPVARLMRARIRTAGGEGDRMLVESFVMLDPVQSFRSGSVPYWMFFGVDSGFDDLQRHLRIANESGDPYADVDVVVFPNGVPSTGSVPPERWSELRRYVTGEVRLLAGTRKRWPAHFDSLVRYGPALRRLPDGVPPGSRPALSVSETLHALGAARTVLPKPRTEAAAR